METKSNYIEFEREIRKRGINYLIHFTPTINLYSILEQSKLLSRELLENLNIEQTDILDYIEFTDRIRFDDKSYINLSIQHPNTFLFNKFTERTRDLPHINWCVLKIDSKYIYQKDTLFSVTNAANSYNKKFVGVTGEFTKFSLMFSSSLQIVTSNSRRILTRNNLPDKYTTDEQAEVLVKDEIPFSDVKEVCFKNKDELASAVAALNSFDTSKFVVDEIIFKRDRL